MAASDWLAALGGGLEGVDRTRKDIENRDQRAQLAELKAMLEQIKEGGRNDRTDKTLTTRREVADADRKQRADAVIANTDLGYTRIASNEGIAGQRDDTSRRGQDLGDSHYWDMAGRDWSKAIMGDTTRRRGQDIGASTAARGQDLVHGDRQDALDAAGDTSRARNALGVLGLKARQKPSIFGTSGDPTDWANEFDRLYTGGASPDDLTTPDAPPAAVPAAPAMPAPVAPGPRPAMPPPRPQPQGAAPQGLQAGVTVRLRNGKRVTVTKVNPDGTFEYR